MVTIKNEKIEMEEALKNKIEFICSFCNVLLLLLLMVVFVKLINLICNM